MLDIYQPVFIDNYAFVPKFRTSGSVSFAVVRSSDESDVRDEKGWVDIHEILAPERSIVIRGALPSECLRFGFLRQLLASLSLRLQISEMISRDVIFFQATDCIDMSRRVDGMEDDGTAGEITTSRSFRFPRDS